MASHSPRKPRPLDVSAFSPHRALASAVASSSSSSPGELQRRLADEAGGRDVSKLALTRLRRAVAFYRQQLGAAVHVAAPSGSPRRGCSEEAAASCSRRIRELAEQLELELRIAPEPVPGPGGNSLALQERLLQPGSPTKGYEVMRHSLDDAQRRCENLNCDKGVQAEANDVLVDALGSVKDANKALLEQIRGQSDEIAQLTMLRIGDEERLQHLGRRHREDGECVRQHAQQKAAAIREAADVQQAAMDRRFNELKRQLCARLAHVGRGMAQLGQDRKNLGADFSAMTEEMQNQLGILSRDVEIRNAGLGEAARATCSALEETIENAELQLASERERRQDDSLSWLRRLAATQADIDNIQASMTQELGCLTPQVTALDRCLVNDRRAWPEECNRLHRDADEHAQKVVSHRGALEQMQGQLVRTESAVSAAECQVRSQEQILAELRRHIRESDDMLAAAVSGNEHLRAQMDEQQRRLQERNEVDLGDSRLGLEQKMSELQTTHETDMNLATLQLQAMAQQSQRFDDAVQPLLAEVSATASECEALGRDAIALSGQHGAATAARAVATKELAEVRKTASLQRVEIQVDSDLLQTEITSTGQDIDRLLAQFGELKRTAAAREVEAETHASSGESSVKDLEAQLADSRRRLLEVLEACQRLETDTSDRQHNGLEEQVALEQRHDDTKRSFAEEQSALSSCLSAEQRASQHAKEQFDHERTSAMGTMQLAHEESRCRLLAAERERSHVEDVRCRELTEVADVADQRQRRAEALGRDLEKARHLLNESSSNLAWVRQEESREEREAALEVQHLRDEVRQLGASVESAGREERSLTHQVIIADEASPDHRPTRVGSTIEEPQRNSPPPQNTSPTSSTMGLHNRLEDQIQQLQAHTDELHLHSSHLLASTAAAMSPRALASASPILAASDSFSETSKTLRSPVIGVPQPSASPSRNGLGLTATALPAAARSPTSPLSVGGMLTHTAVKPASASFTTPPPHGSTMGTPSRLSSGGGLALFNGTRPSSSGGGFAGPSPPWEPVTLDVRNGGGASGPASTWIR